MRYKFLLFFLLVAIQTLAAQEISNVKIINILNNNAEIQADEYSDLVIGEKDTITFNYQLEELAGNVKNAYIFKTVFKNSAGDSAIKTSGAPNCKYSMLQEDNYELAITAFDVNGEWVTAPEIIKFRVNNKESYLLQENKKLLAEKKIAAETLAGLKNNEKNTNFDFENNKILFLAAGVLLIVLLILIAILILQKNKIKKKNTEILNDLESKKTLSEENQKLQAQVEADTAEMIELKKTIEQISKKMTNMVNVNFGITSNIELVSAKNNELESLQETKNKIFSEILARGISDPTTSIKSLVELLRSYDFNANDTKDIVENIIEETHKIIFMSEDIQRLIEFEKQEKIALQYENVAIDKLIEKAVSLNKNDALQRKIEIETKINPNANEFYLDHDKVLIILHNLINNAVKYTYGGGKVFISCEKDVQKPAKLQFEVRDNGIGISEKDLKYFSESSDKIGSQSAEKIGFLTVKKYVEAHHGTLNVASTLGKGSTFSFTIPDLRKL